jgi:hypothetical protein
LPPKQNHDEIVETLQWTFPVVVRAVLLNCIITIRRSRRSARLLHLGGSTFFAAVRQKLHWSGSFV